MANPLSAGLVQGSETSSNLPLSILQRRSTFSKWIKDYLPRIRAGRAEQGLREAEGELVDRR
jgi:hypothetical protein